MKIAFSATNPCHLWPLAQALHTRGNLECYYSGYPKWKLQAEKSISVRSLSGRTLVTYGLLRLPEPLRPPLKSLFRWQDIGFDRAVSKALKRSSVIHGLPGQCLHTFRKAKEFNSLTVLNHASGPVSKQIELLVPEYDRAEIPWERNSPFDSGYFQQEDEEYELADYHCVASTVVRDQLVDHGIARERILIAPYGADPSLFRKRVPPSRQGQFRIVFAGGLTLRKGIHYLLKALEEVSIPSWECHFYGLRSSETARDFSSYGGNCSLSIHGPVSQETLANAFRDASVLVLPSVEEAFGLVVVQALQCGIPCIVSDRVGAKDLIQHRHNGSIFPFGDLKALSSELLWWEENPTTVTTQYDWEQPTTQFIEEHQRVTGVEVENTSEEGSP